MSLDSPSESLLLKIGLFAGELHTLFQELCCLDFKYMINLAAQTSESPRASDLLYCLSHVLCFWVISKLLHDHVSQNTSSKNVDWHRVRKSFLKEVICSSRFTGLLFYLLYPMWSLLELNILLSSIDIYHTTIIYWFLILQEISRILLSFFWRYENFTIPVWYLCWYLNKSKMSYLNLLALDIHKYFFFL